MLSSANRVTLPPYTPKTLADYVTKDFVRPAAIGRQLLTREFWPT